LLFLEVKRKIEEEAECVLTSPFITQTSERILLRSQHMVPEFTTKKYVKNLGKLTVKQQFILLYEPPILANFTK
jgi:hypothetical protein